MIGGNAMADRRPWRPRVLTLEDTDAVVVEPAVAGMTHQITSLRATNGDTDETVLLEVLSGDTVIDAGYCGPGGGGWQDSSPTQEEWGGGLHTLPGAALSIKLGNVGTAPVKVAIRGYSRAIH